MIFKKLIVLLILSSLLGLGPQRTSSAELEIVKQPTLEQHIERIFGKNAKVAMATLKAESGLKLNAKGYNCIYNGKSKACKKVDRSKAWSVDCGVAQVNVRGQVCPKKLLTLEGNMEKVEKIYKEQGLRAWAAYSTGRYKKFL